MTAHLQGSVHMDAVGIPAVTAGLATIVNDCFFKGNLILPKRDSFQTNTAVF